MNHRTATTKEFWAEGSGQMPIRLSPVSNKAQFILLDGGVYDFCLDLTGEESDASNYYSAAWSSDVKNYIVLMGDDVVVHNWSRSQSDKVKLSLVQDKFMSFLRILNNNSYRTSDDVAPFVLGLFSQLRNLTWERHEPVEALNLLFKLLVSLQEDNLTPAVCEKWGILNVAEPTGFEALRDSIRRGVRHITPNLDYILRHGSGPLFETAHREALYFDTQLDLFGKVSSRVGYATAPKYTGVHYTPRYLVRSIVENALKHIDINSPRLTILDPSCGSGAFLQEVLKQLREKDYTGKITLKGYDISPMAELTTKFLLDYENRSQWNGRLHLEIRQQDSLRADWGENDLILMNPPFVSSELIKDADTKELVNSILDSVQLKRRPNMAASFLYKAVLSLSEGGVIGAVLPSSLQQQDQYAPLRTCLREMLRLETVSYLGNFVFSGALTDTCFILGVKETGSHYTPVNIWCSNREQSAFEAMKGWRKMQYDNATERVRDDYNIYTPSHFPLVKNSWKVLPKSADDFMKQIVLMERQGDLKPLNNIFFVRQGIIKGNRDLFEIDEQSYMQLPKTERKLYRQIASSQTIGNGSLRKIGYVWYPYSQQGLLIATEEDFRNQYPLSYEWLHPHKDVLQRRAKVSKWWDLTRSRSDLFCRSEQWLCSKRSGSSHSFAIVPEGCVVEEGNVFVFKNSRYIEEDKYFYLSFFSSSVFQRMLSIYARPLKAGYDLGNAQIKDIPIIDVDKEGLRQSESYRKLVSYGKEYAEGYTARRDYFDKYVLAFY